MFYCTVALALAPTDLHAKPKPNDTSKQRIALHEHAHSHYDPAADVAMLRWLVESRRAVSTIRLASCWNGSTNDQWTSARSRDDVVLSEKRGVHTY